MRVITQHTRVHSFHKPWGNAASDVGTKRNTVKAIGGERRRGEKKRARRTSEGRGEKRHWWNLTMWASWLFGMRKTRVVHLTWGWECAQRVHSVCRMRHSRARAVVTGHSSASPHFTPCVQYTSGRTSLKCRAAERTPEVAVLGAVTCARRGAHG